MPTTDSAEFDYLVVGAGSTGSVLAARLAEAKVGTVAVIEAGRRRFPKITAIPGATFRTIGHRNYDWGYFSEPDPSRQDRKEMWPRGKGPGGSSLINGMIFVRGNPADFNAWADAGAKGWSYADVLPYFVRMESSEMQGQGRGNFGPQSVSKLRYRSPLTPDFLKAAEEAGYRYNADFNDGDQLGFGWVQATQKNGRRQTAFEAFLEPLVRAGRIKLYEEAATTRVVFEGRRATGLKVVQGGQTLNLKARKGVILSAGSLNTPHLLMVSGIGPHGALRALNIPVVHDAPEVGRNLMEHVGLWIRAEVDVPTLNQEATPLRTALALGQWLFGHGPATASTAQALGFIDSQGEGEAPDIQIHFSPLSISRGPKGPSLPPQRLISVVPSVNHPKSRGEINLRSADWRDAPIIRPKLLDCEEDLATLGRGVRICQSILQAPHMAGHIVSYLNPPPPESDPAAFEAYLRSLAAPLYHPVGTCRMGSDKDAVVDPQLKVRGVEGLFVADASIMPSQISGNTHATAMMIGEKAADLLSTHS